MKVRYTTKCARCQVEMQPGALAVRQFGGLWHAECWMMYRKHRVAVLSGK